MSVSAPFLSRRSYLLGAALIAVLVIMALWLAALFRAPADSGSLEDRVTAVAATVRCPVCPEPIPLNDIHNAQALQMRQFIRDELRRGRTEDQVRQELAAGYGQDILLAPPQRGFDLLAWLVPLAVVVGCAVGVILAVRRWSSAGGTPDIAAPPTGPAALNPELRPYEELLDRELAARE